MDLGLKGKVAVVTGASKGIGLETARQLLQEGAKVAICSRTAADIQKAGEMLSQYGEVYYCLLYTSHRAGICQNFPEY